METTKFLDLDCIELGNESLSLLVTTGVGPRILNLRFKQGENLFAELPDSTLECPGVGEYRLWGGHRLWHAPEKPRRTYLPDDQPLDTVFVQGGVRVTQPVEPGSGIVKSLTITLPGDGPTVIVDHVLENGGLWQVELAPWAITQMKPGGFAILPQPTGDADEAGVLPNRLISLWPYTDITSPHINWGNRYIFVKANMQDGALKVGYPNPTGWIAYYVDDTLFVKYAEYLQTEEYFDNSSSSECYCSQYFLELETLGACTALEPGGRVVHRETWKLFNVADLEPDEDTVNGLVEQLGL